MEQIEERRCRLISLALSTSLIKHNAKELPDLLRYGVERFEVGRVKEEEIDRLTDFLKRNPVSFGIHAPLPSPSGYKKLTKKKLTPQNRAALWASALNTCQTASRLKANYIIFHLPWYSRKTLEAYLKKHSLHQLKELLAEDCRYLQNLYLQIGIPIVLEVHYLHPRIFPPDLLWVILQGNPYLGTCLDVGHLHCSLPYFPGETLAGLADCLLPKIKVAHLYNCKMSSQHRHKPAKPSQNPADGWIDLPSLIPHILKFNPRCLLVLEVTKTHIRTTDDIRESMEWIKGLAGIDSLTPNSQEFLSPGVLR